MIAFIQSPKTLTRPEELGIGRTYQKGRRRSPHRLHFMLCVRPISQLSPSNPNFMCQRMAMKRLLLFLKPFDANPVLHSDAFSRVTTPQVYPQSMFILIQTFYFCVEVHFLTLSDTHLFSWWVFAFTLDGHLQLCVGIFLNFRALDFCSF